MTFHCLTSLEPESDALFCLLQRLSLSIRTVSSATLPAEWRESDNNRGNALANWTVSVLSANWKLNIRFETWRHFTNDGNGSRPADEFLFGWLFGSELSLQLGDLTEDSVAEGFGGLMVQTCVRILLHNLKREA